jgi:outer membrane lipoprotein carrier protein
MAKMKFFQKNLMATTFWVFCLMATLAAGGIVAADTARAQTALPLDQILDRLEARYNSPGFSARFKQESTIKAMEITDTATGKIYIRRPDSMRWEYETPEKQVIISDSRTMWIYKPEDNQLVVGNAPDFFGDGKGAGFLSDMKILRRKFKISAEKNDGNGNYVLKLVPLEASLDLSHIFLTVSAQTFDIMEVVTYNEYKDENRIIISDIQFQKKPDPVLFRFAVPEGADVVRMDQ